MDVARDEGTRVIVTNGNLRGVRDPDDLNLLRARRRRIIAELTVVVHAPTPHVSLIAERAVKLLAGSELLDLLLRRPAVRTAVCVRRAAVRACRAAVLVR